MTILGIESATAVCGAAVVHNGALVAEVETEERYVHAEQLLPHIDTVLRRAGRSVCSLDGVAVSIGPGSFTGLRIGLSVAKGLTAVCGLPLLAVSTLAALATRAAESFTNSAGAPLLAAVDARRDEVYCQLFERRNGGVAPLWDPRDMPVGKLVRELGDLSVVLTGDGGYKVLEAARRHQDDAPSRLILVPPGLARCNAGVVARLGERMLAEGVVADSSTLEPMYIKEFFFADRQK